MLNLQQTGRLFLASLALTASVFLSSCKKDEPVATNTVTDVVLKDPQFTYLRAAVVKAGLSDALRTGTLTVFAPTDDAFKASGFPTIASVEALPAATLAAVLQYHVLNTKVLSTAIAVGNNQPVTTLNAAAGPLYITKTSTGISVNGKNVTTADVAVDNGVIHVINGVLMPPAGSVVDLVTTGTQAPNFTLLTAAVLRAGLATGLASTTGVTIFAPTDAAFAAENITLATINNTLTPAQLTRILQYHIVPTRAFSTNLTDNATLPTLLTGGLLRTNVSGTGVTVTGNGNGTRTSRVVTPNILTTNGVVHVIDRLLLPPP